MRIARLNKPVFNKKESPMTPKANFILIRPLENDEGFLAYAIGLDGCVVEGRTEEETLANIKEAIATWRPAEAPRLETAA
jgi:predicted RNase H-like HicB family nuclease